MIKLMIVDDEISTREGLINYISWQELGIDIADQAEDGEIALKLAGQFQPDILLTDVKMPRMDGIELANHIRECFPACKIIFLSSYSDKEYLKSAIQLQAIDYIEKPVNIEEVKTIIRKVVAICRAEQERRNLENRLQDKISQNSYLSKENLTLELINSCGNSPDLSEKFSSLGLQYPADDPLITAIIALNWTGQQNNLTVQIQRGAIIEDIEQEFESYSLHCICGFQDYNSIVSLVYGKKLELLLLKSILEKVKTGIEQLYPDNRRIFIGIGKNVTGIANIPISYQTAMTVVQRQFFTGYNQVKLYEPGTNPIYQFDNSLIKKFQDLINSDKSNESVSLINQIVNDLCRFDGTSINQIKNFFLQMVMALSKIAEERNILVGEPSEQFSWNTISKSITLQEIQSYFIQEVEQFFQVQADSDHKSKVVCNIIKYIRQNYHNKNLSIKDLSEHLYLTPNYLCLLFKKETGKTINQYITETRVEKSKELLKDRRIKLYAIAELVGYSDPNYFSKIFKKTTHFNPSDFRERNLS